MAVYIISTLFLEGIEIDDIQISTRWGVQMEKPRPS